MKIRIATRIIELDLGIMGFHPCDIIYDEDYTLTHVYFKGVNVLGWIRPIYIEEIKQEVFDQDAFEKPNRFTKADDQLKSEKER
jgi:hypothetical protein